MNVEVVAGSIWFDWDSTPDELTTFLITGASETFIDFVITFPPGQGPCKCKLLHILYRNGGDEAITPRATVQEALFTAPFTVPALALGYITLKIDCVDGAPNVEWGGFAEAAPLIAPSLIEPIASANIISTGMGVATVEFEWEDTGADSYELHVDGNTYVVSIDGADSFYEMELPLGPHLWYVDAIYGGVVASGEGNEREFSIAESLCAVPNTEYQLTGAGWINLNSYVVSIAGGVVNIAAVPRNARLFYVNTSEPIDEIRIAGFLGSSEPFQTFEGPGGLSIPDASPGTGVSSGVVVPDIGTIGAVQLALNIQHEYRGDLRVRLSHGAQTVTVFNYTGGSADNIVGTFDVAGFTGSAEGLWTLTVDDREAPDAGTIESWAVRIAPAPSVETGPGAESLFQIALENYPGKGRILIADEEIVPTAATVLFCCGDPENADIIRWHVPGEQMPERFMLGKIFAGNYGGLYEPGTSGGPNYPATDMDAGGWPGFVKNSDAQGQFFSSKTALVDAIESMYAFGTPLPGMLSTYSTAGGPGIVCPATVGGASTLIKSDRTWASYSDMKAATTSPGGITNFLDGELAVDNWGEKGSIAVDFAAKNAGVNQGLLDWYFNLPVAGEPTVPRDVGLFRAVGQTGYPLYKDDPSGDGTSFGDEKYYSASGNALISSYVRPPNDSAADAEALFDAAGGGMAFAARYGGPGDLWLSSSGEHSLRYARPLGDFTQFEDTICGWYTAPFFMIVRLRAYIKPQVLAYPTLPVPAAELVGAALATGFDVQIVGPHPELVTGARFYARHPTHGVTLVEGVLSGADYTATFTGLSSETDYSVWAEYYGSGGLISLDAEDSAITITTA